MAQATVKKAFLPVNAQEMKERGWEVPDFVYVVGEAYVDHPSFGHAIISRVLEHAGYKVAMLCLPDCSNVKAFMQFGRPKLGFLVTSGVIDSMVNHYTTAKKKRREDVYAPGGKAGMRPDRAVTVYSNKIHHAYPGIPILIGGVEASLRRFSHYDYWDDKVRRSVLVDSTATLLLFGMGETCIVECAKWLENGRKIEDLSTIQGICYMAKEPPEKVMMIPSHEEVATDKRAYAKSVYLQQQEQNPFLGKPLCQKQDEKRFLVQNPPPRPLTTKELDAVHALPFMKEYHPMYESQGGVPAFDEVRFSIQSVRGCFGGCNFCALAFHQGRIIQARSKQSILKEARQMTQDPKFKGYIHDVGGPTANFRQPSCQKQCKVGTCKNKQCLTPSPCKNLHASHDDFIDLLQELRAIPKVKKVFIRSGLRYDYIMEEKSDAFMRELCAHHISGQLKVAPEHISDNVLSKMGKPSFDVFRAFVKRYERINKELGMRQFLVPYLMSSHPGARLEDAIKMAEYLRDTGRQVEQVQDFYPTPGTVSTCMYYTGLDPNTMKPVYVPKTVEEKAMQRALLQFKNPKNFDLVRKALRECGRDALIGNGKQCLVPLEREYQNVRPMGQRQFSSKPSAQRQSSSRTSSKSSSSKNSSSKNSSSQRQQPSFGKPSGKPRFSQNASSRQQSPKKQSSKRR